MRDLKPAIAAWKRLFGGPDQVARDALDVFGGNARRFLVWELMLHFLYRHAQDYPIQQVSLLLRGYGPVTLPNHGDAAVARGLFCLRQLAQGFISRSALVIAGSQYRRDELATIRQYRLTDSGTDLLVAGLTASANREVLRLYDRLLSQPLPWLGQTVPPLLSESHFLFQARWRGQPLLIGADNPCADGAVSVQQPMGFGDFDGRMLVLVHHW